MLSFIHFVIYMLLGAALALMGIGPVQAVVIMFLAISGSIVSYFDGRSKGSVL